MSDETGGFAVVNQNDFTAAYRRIVADSSSYYVLAYTPAVERRDGKFHKIEIKVSRPGVTVKAKKGYLAPKLQNETTAAGTARGESGALSEALNSPLPVSGLTMHIFAAPFKGGATESLVLLGTELSGADLALTSGDKMEVGYVAIDAAGQTRAGHTSTIMLNVQPAAKTRIQESGLRLLSRLSLPPGHYQLRVAARDEASDRVGSVVDALDVPDFSRSPLALSGIVLTSSTASFMVTAQPDPVLQPVMPGPPAALRRFPQTDTVAVYAEAYGREATSPGAVTMNATVTDGAGKVVFTSAGTPSSAPQADPAKTSLALRVPMNDLPPGSYVLTVTARSQATDESPATRRVPFTVVSAPPRTTPSADAPVAPAVSEADEDGSQTPAILGPCCPNEPSYEAAVRAFAHGDRHAASIAIARAPADQVKRAVDHLGGGDEPLLEAAAVMHLVLAASAMEAGYLPQMTVQLKHSDAIFQKIRRPGDSAFIASWYAAVTGICLSIGDVNGAAAMVKRGLDEKVNVRLAEGIVDETKGEVESRTLANNPSDYDESRRANSTAAMLGVRLSDRRPFYEQTGRGRRSFDLGNAEKAYRQVLKKDATSKEAGLRLGRVLALEGKDAEAQTRLEGLVAASHDPRILYLAHLFLADLAAHQKSADAAARQYKAALAAHPLSRIAYIGLSNVALLAGDETRAQEYIRGWSFRNTAPADEAWLQYEHGIDQLQPALNALLRMISQ